MHDSPSAGHPGIVGTYKRIKKNFYWHGIKKDIIKWVKECDTCQRNKAENVSYHGLLQPLPIREQIWEDVSMDYIIGLPKSKGYNIIFVLVDRLSKYSHFWPMKLPYTAQSVAQLFFHGDIQTPCTSQEHCICE